MTARLLPLNDGWFSPLHFQAIRGGVFGTWLCLASLHYHGVLLKYLPVSVILFGLMSLAGVIAQREEAPRQTGDGAETGASPPQIAAISFSCSWWQPLSRAVWNEPFLGVSRWSLPG